VERFQYTVPYEQYGYYSRQKPGTGMRRELESSFLSILTQNRDTVVIVEGARQVGKSYFLNEVLRMFARQESRQLFAYDLEKEEKLRRQIDRTEDFIDFRDLMTDSYGVQAGSVLFFDEAQESRRLARYVKSFKEDWSNVQVVLSGSSMNRFFPKDMRIPVGRYRSLCLYGFSFSEFIQFVHGPELAEFIRSAPDTISSSRHELLLSWFNDYLNVGGYPEAVRAFKEQGNWVDVINDILSSLEEDFERKEAYQPKLFRDAIAGIANHIGSPSKFTHFDTSKYHAKQITSALTQWHIAYEVEPQAIPPGKGGNFLPKRYLHDCGVVQERRAVAAPPISLLTTIDPLLRTSLGGLIENAVLIQLLSGQSASLQIGTWKKDAGSSIEVDFVLKLPQFKLSLPIECKATVNVKKKHFRNLLHYLDLTHQRIGLLISAAPLKFFSVDEKMIIQIPLYLASRKNIEAYVMRGQAMLNPST